LRIKFFIYYLPLLALTEILIVATNMLLKVTPFMMVLSTSRSSVWCRDRRHGIGLGAAYPDFKPKTRPRPPAASEALFSCSPARLHRCRDPAAGRTGVLAVHG